MDKIERKYYRDTTLEGIARRILCAYEEELYAGQPKAVPIEEIIEAHGITLVYQYIRKNGRILGKTIFEDGVDAVWDMDEQQYILFPVQAGTILIDATLCEDEKKLGRLRFTCAHELAHWLLHKSIFEAVGQDDNIDAITEACCLEVQANMLASAILMPLPQIKKCFYKLHSAGVKWRSEVIRKMAELFQVSVQAMEIRLTQQRLV